jgi:hypothetical protein
MKQLRLRSAVVAACVLGWAAAAPAQTDAGGVYAIDSGATQIFWQIYSAGALAKLGHNHVIAVDGLTGSVTLGAGDTPSRFTMQFPVASLVIDDPDLRAARGEQFESQPTESDVAGTRHNMLSDKLLKGDEYPMIRVSGTHGGGDLSDTTLDLTVELVGRQVQLRAPAKIRIDGDTLTADGQMTVSHAQLGLTPFSAALGALKVADDIDFFYHVVARRNPQGAR